MIVSTSLSFKRLSSHRWFYMIHEILCDASSNSTESIYANVFDAYGSRPSANCRLLLESMGMRTADEHSASNAVTHTVQQNVDADASVLAGHSDGSDGSEFGIAWIGSADRQESLCALPRMREDGLSTGHGL
jgi:hypothetical protein